MTILEFRDRVIENGIASVHQYEKEEHRKRGCLHGFDVCKTLVTPKDFEDELTERAREELDIIRERERHQSTDSEVHKYWEYRCATSQIEHVYERMKVAWHYSHMHHFDSLSSRAVMQYAKIVGVGPLN